MKKTAFRMKYQGKQSAFPFKSPIKNEKLIGPVKPMDDKDGDGIPDYVDADGGDGSKNKNPQPEPRKKKKKGKAPSPKKGSEVQEIIQIDPTIKPPMGLDR